MKTISFVLPIYNEELTIAALWDALIKLESQITSRYTVEFVFVNDGSSDSSIELLNQLQSDSSVIKVIDFSRNFGHQTAVTAGVDNASGDAVIIMDSDLQDPPEVCLDLIKKWEQGYEVAYAQRISRKDSLFKRLTAWAFYWTLDKLSDVEIPRNTGDFRLIDEKVVDALKNFPEHNRFLRGMISSIGFKQVAVPFERHERYAGETGYPLKKMIRFATDGILGFSDAPIRLVTKLGFLVAGASLIGILYTLITYVAFSPVSGWTFLSITIFFMSGVQMIILGVLGQYIARIYTEAKQRPLYIVRSIEVTKPAKK